MSFGKVAKDFQSCLKNIQSFTDGQAHVVDWDCDKLTWLKIQLRPKHGPYAKGMFDFSIHLPKRYPREVPNVSCLTTVYHPNIDPDCEEYNVCLSLFDEWQETFGLEDVIQGLLFLMNYPNLDDPLSSYFDPSMDQAEFEENVQKSLAGETIEDCSLTFEYVLVIEKEEDSVIKEEGGSPEDSVKNEAEACADTDSGIENEDSVDKSDEQVNKYLKPDTQENVTSTEAAGLANVTEPETDNVEDSARTSEEIVSDIINAIVETVANGSECEDEKCEEKEEGMSELFGWEQVIVLDDDEEGTMSNAIEIEPAKPTENSPQTEQTVASDVENSAVSNNVECSAETETDAETNTSSRPAQSVKEFEAFRENMLNQLNDIVDGLTEEDFKDDEDDDDEDECDEDEDCEEEEEEEEPEFGWEVRIVDDDEEGDTNTAENNASTSASDRRQMSVIEKENLVNGLSFGNGSLVRQISKLERGALPDGGIRDHRFINFGGADEILKVRNMTFMDPQMDVAAHFFTATYTFLRNRFS